MIISLTGIDCSGKTTQLDLLEQAARAKRFRVSRFWFRPGYSRELDSLRSLVRKLRPGALPTAEYREQRSKVFSKRSVRATWVAMAVADTLVQLGAKVRALSLSGRIVLCDRYLDDALIDLKLRFPELGHLHTAIGILLRNTCPAADRTFLLQLPHDQMLRRMAIKNEPFPDDPITRDARFAEYQKLADKVHIELVDASKPVDWIHRDLKARLPDLFGGLVYRPGVDDAGVEDGSPVAGQATPSVASGDSSPAGGGAS